MMVTTATAMIPILFVLVVAVMNRLLITVVVMVNALMMMRVLLALNVEVCNDGVILLLVMSFGRMLLVLIIQ